MKAERRKEGAPWQGRNWCRPSTRLALYLRDGLACVWCGEGVENGVVLSLDHVLPVSRGGTNDPSNLVTACTTCNQRRGKKSVAQFASELAGGIVEDAEKIVARLRRVRRRKLPRKTARRILQQRPNLTEAIHIASK